MRTRLRFSLLFLLIASAVFGLVIALLATNVQRVRSEIAFVNELREKGGIVDGTPRRFQRFYRIFGDELAFRPTIFRLEDSRITDEDLARIATLPKVRGLYLGRTQISDVGFAKLSRMTDLEHLTAQRTAITTCPSFKKMTKLTKLDLKFCNVSYVDCEGLQSLETLGLRGTNVDDRTLQSLPKLQSLKTLDVAGGFTVTSKISDGGMKNITPDRLPSLRSIYLYSTEVTDEMVDRLRERFPTASVIRYPDKK